MSLNCSFCNDFERSVCLVPPEIVLMCYKQATLVAMFRRLRRCPSGGGGGGQGASPGKFSKNEAKSCILSEKGGGGSGNPGTHTGHAPGVLTGHVHEHVLHFQHSLY